MTVTDGRREASERRQVEDGVLINAHMTIYNDDKKIYTFFLIPTQATYYSTSLNTCLFPGPLSERVCAHT